MCVILHGTFTTKMNYKTIYWYLPHAFLEILFSAAYACLDTASADSFFLVEY